MKKRYIILQILLIISLEAHSQIDTFFVHTHLGFDGYLQRVTAGNLGYAANRYDVSIAEAAIRAAGVLPDPYVAFEWADNRENAVRTSYEYSAGIGTTLELGGKRRARIDLARNEYELSAALLSDYFRNLRADAALAFLKCLKERQLYNVVWDSYQTMKRLTGADSIRYRLGSIMEIDATQSSVETGILYNDLILAATEWKNSIIELTTLTGQSSIDTLVIPAGKCIDSCRIYSLQDLIETALENRSDLLAALRVKDVSRGNLDVVKSSRVPDLDLSLSYSRALEKNRSVPSATGLTGGVSVPLKFSDINRGELRMGQEKISQSEVAYQQVALQIRSEISRAWNIYYVYCRQVDNFESGLLKKAEDVLKGKIYSYRRGENSLLEVLNAQRTYNDVRTAYYEAVFNRASAQVDLERAAGIWNIRF